MRSLLIAVLTLAGLSPAMAHVFASNLGPAAGFAHPFLGIDHLLAMFSVGVLSAAKGRRAIWLLPGGFAAGVITGGLLGLRAAGLPFVETGIALSVILLGAALLAGRAWPLAAGTAIAALFGLYHGYAHGSEIPVGASTPLYFAGFVAGTAGLHLIGVFAGLLCLEYRSGASAVRLYGGALIVAGLWLALRA